MPRKTNYKHFTCPDGMSYCTKCKSYDLSDNFPNSKEGPNGKHWWCKKCVSAYQSRNKERSVLYNKKKNYGIAGKEYLDLWNKQKGVCAICGQPETKIYKGTRAWLSVDHNHQTGEVRALLCSACNVGLGSFRDDIELLEKAVAYLQRTDRERTQNPRVQLDTNTTCNFEQAETLTREIKGLPKHLTGKNTDTAALPLFEIAT